MQLMTPSQLKEYVAASSSLVKTTEWIENFLAKPHAELGRVGLVCPFVPRSLKLETIQLVEISMNGMNQADLEELVKEYRQTFLEQLPQQGKLAIYKALLLVFSDLPDDQCHVIDQVQKTLKPFFVEKGLMLGEFHRFNQSPGLHNPNFRPLQSPVPMLAIRFMTESDLPFLSRVTDSPQLRVQYLEAYLEQMATIVAGGKLTEARRALAEARRTVQEMETVPTKCPFKRLMEIVKPMWSIIIQPFGFARKGFQSLFYRRMPNWLGWL